MAADSPQSSRGASSYPVARVPPAPRQAPALVLDGVGQQRLGLVLRLLPQDLRPEGLVLLLQHSGEGPRGTAGADQKHCTRI